MELTARGEPGSVCFAGFPRGSERQGANILEIISRQLLKMGAMVGAGLALPLGALSVPVGRLLALSVRSPSVEPHHDIGNAAAHV